MSMLSRYVNSCQLVSYKVQATLGYIVRGLLMKNRVNPPDSWWDILS